MTSHFKLDGAAPLAHLGAIRATGTDAAAFLHGQLTNDFTLLDTTRARLAGYCSPKGRLLASFVAWKSSPDEVLLLCSADVLPATLKRLSMFVLRAKCKLTDATVEHRAAELTMKLVRDHGGEAIADTSWSVITDSGDPVGESVGAYASMVLAEGDYTIVAKNKDRIYQRDFTVEAGHNQEVEVLANESAASDAAESAD